MLRSGVPDPIGLPGSDESGANSAARLYGCNQPEPPGSGEISITFSHFLPRIDLMSANASRQVNSLYPILDSARIDAEVRCLGVAIHVYGHSRLPRNGIQYVNNAFGYTHNEHDKETSDLHV